MAREGGLQPYTSIFPGGAGNVPTLAFSIESGTSADFFEGDLVKPVNNGSITPCTAVTETLVLGVFVGCEYVDSSGQKQWSNHYTDTISREDTIAHVICNPYQLYKIAIANSDADTTLTRAEIFLNYDIEFNGGNTVTGKSGMNLDSGTAGVTTTAQLKLVGLVNESDGGGGYGVVETATFSHGIVMIDPTINYWRIVTGI